MFPIILVYEAERNSLASVSYGAWYDYWMDRKESHSLKCNITVRRDIIYPRFFISAFHIRHFTKNTVNEDEHRWVPYSSRMVREFKTISEEDLELTILKGWGKYNSRFSPKDDILRQHLQFKYNLELSYDFIRSEEEFKEWINKPEELLI